MCPCVLLGMCGGGYRYYHITGGKRNFVSCVIFHKFRQLVPTKDDRKLESSTFSMMLGMGVPMGLQFSITAIGSMVMQSANNSLGSIYVSGFTAAVKIKQFALCPFDAMATAVSVFCSQNLGAGQAKRIRQGLFQGMAVAVGYGIFAGLVLIVFGALLVHDVPEQG